MKHQRRSAPEELLAAHADDGLHPEERAAVERYLAEHPAARQELDALRAIIAQARDLAPEPAREPDWDRMLGDIGRACDAELAPDRAGLAARLRGWLGSALRPRYAMGLAVCAAAAIALVLFALEGRRSSTGDVTDHRADLRLADPDRATPEVFPDPEARDILDPAAATVIDDLGGLTDPATAATEIGTLDESALDTVLEELDFATLVESESTGSDLDGIGAPKPFDSALDDSLDPLLAPELVAEWSHGTDTLALTADAADGPVDAAEGLFGEADYEALLNGLSGEELDALATYLEKGEAG